MRKIPTGAATSCPTNKGLRHQRDNAAPSAKLALRQPRWVPASRPSCLPTVDPRSGRYHPGNSSAHYAPIEPAFRRLSPGYASFAFRQTAVSSARPVLRPLDPVGNPPVSTRLRPPPTRRCIALRGLHHRYGGYPSGNSQHLTAGAPHTTTCLRPLLPRRSPSSRHDGSLAARPSCLLSVDPRSSRYAPGILTALYAPFTPPFRSRPGTTLTLRPSLLAFPLRFNAIRYELRYRYVSGVRSIAACPVLRSLRFPPLPTRYQQPCLRPFATPCPRLTHSAHSGQVPFGIPAWASSGEDQASLTPI